MKLALKTMPAATALVLALASGAGVEARQKPRAKAKAAPSKEKTTKEPQDELARLREELIRSTKEYKTSLEQLLALYEKDVKRADEQVSKMKELFNEGLISKRELEREQQVRRGARGLDRVQALARDVDGRGDVFLREPELAAPGPHAIGEHAQVWPRAARASSKRDIAPGELSGARVSQ